MRLLLGPELALELHGRAGELLRIRLQRLDLLDARFKLLLQGIATRIRRQQFLFGAREADRLSLHLCFGRLELLNRRGACCLLGLQSIFALSKKGLRGSSGITLLLELPVLVFDVVLHLCCTLRRVLQLGPDGLKLLAQGHDTVSVGVHVVKGQPSHAAFAAVILRGSWQGRGHTGRGHSGPEFHSA